MVLAFLFYTFFPKYLYLLKTSVVGRQVYLFLNKKWLFDRLYNEFVVQTFLN